MTQTWYEDTYRANHVAATDIERITSNFNTLRSSFSGTSAPSNPVAGMPWFDTSKKLLKIRNQANNAWLGVLMGLTTSKVAVYKNSAGDGWVDSGLSGDKILAIKGGSTYVTGAASAGTWTISGLSTLDNGHGHKWYQGATNRYFFNASGVAFFPPYYTHGNGFCITEYHNDFFSWTVDAYTEISTHSHTLTHDGSWRIAASVVTVQYPNV